MVNALVDVSDDVNRILNLVKAKYNLKDKSEAISFVVKKYAEEEGEPDLNPEFVKKIKKIEKQKSVNVDDFSKRYGLD